MQFTSEATITIELTEDEKHCLEEAATILDDLKDCIHQARGSGNIKATREANCQIFTTDMINSAIELMTEIDDIDSDERIFLDC